MIDRITLKPRMSEKTYGLSLVNNVYTFVVPSEINKDLVARAVAKQFNVTVVDVKVVNQKGKAKRTVRKGSRPTMGKRSDFKKAYVTLKDGDKLPFFETEDDKKKSSKKESK